LTGGVAYFPTSVHGLAGICAQIGLDLKNQYVLGYRSSNDSKNGKWRKIRVKIERSGRGPSLHVRAKGGYFAPDAIGLLK
jgi:Ca-activated chloride channel family protein